MFRPATAACAAIWVVAGCAPALDWREIRAEGAAVVLLPCKPSVFARQIELDGQRLEWSVRVCTASDVTWAVGSGDMVDPARVGPALRVLKAQAAENLRGQVVAERPLTVPGATPNSDSVRIRFRGRLPDGQAMDHELALFVSGTRIYQVTALGAVVSAEALEPFVTSLRIER